MSNFEPCLLSIVASRDTRSRYRTGFYAHAISACWVANETFWKGSHLVILHVEISVNREINKIIKSANCELVFPTRACMSIGFICNCGFL